MLLRPFPLIQEEEGSEPGLTRHPPPTCRAPCRGWGRPSLTGPATAPRRWTHSSASFPSRLPSTSSLSPEIPEVVEHPTGSGKLGAPSHAVPRPGARRPPALLGRAGARFTHHVLSLYLTGPPPDCFGQSGGDLVAYTHTRAHRLALTLAPCAAQSWRISLPVSWLLQWMKPGIPWPRERRGTDVRAGSPGRGRGGAAGVWEVGATPGRGPGGSGAACERPGPLPPAGPARRW